MGPSVDIALEGFGFAERVVADNSQGVAHRRWGGRFPRDDPGGLNSDRVSMARAGSVAVSTLTLMHLGRDCVLRPGRSVKSSQSLMPVNCKKGLHSLRQSAGDCNEDGRMDYLGDLHRASQAQCEVDGRLFLFLVLEWLE